MVTVLPRYTNEQFCDSTSCSSMFQLQIRVSPHQGSTTCADVINAGYKLLQPVKEAVSEVITVIQKPGRETDITHFLL